MLPRRHFGGGQDQRGAFGARDRNPSAAGGSRRLQLEKCLFAVSELPYLGFIVSDDGLKTSPDKVKAVLETKRPEDFQSLRAFLGLLNYYGKFIPRLASVAVPLYHLLKKEAPWRWTSSQEESWKRMKELLSSAEVLCAYNPTLPLTLSCDASPFGVTAVLAHRFPDGSERPVAYASKSLSPAEKNYSLLDKEALAFAFGIKRFHALLYGRSFALITDQKPLLALLGMKSGLRRWQLSACNAGRVNFGSLRLHVGVSSDRRAW